MTEDEWQTAAEPHALLAYLRDKASPRKLRLFAVACSRRMWPWIDPVGQAAVEIAEHFADGLATSEQLRAARLACQGAGGRAAWYAAVSDPAIAARNAAKSAQSAAAQGMLGSSEADELLAQAELVREVFGDPFRPRVLDLSSLRPGPIVPLAQAIYDDGAFQRMSELAAALREAGCDNAEILSHCEQTEGHVRGCWVIDLILQNE
jgi:hypothetical protein